MATKLELAAQFVNSTASHIFLTGKAGTGKTTFLHSLAKATHKNYLVVAPTGIAALNAKGVTIHSQFLFPFGSYLPEPVSFNQNPGANFFSKKELASRHPLNSIRKNVLRSIDLLVIDEVSMLRADLLDAIDYRLKAVKGNFQQSFGGVQLLMIGDLFQLPPIVKDHEWLYLKEFYSSPHFFEAQALKQSGFTYLELDKIFRQSDEHFIDVLNALREDRCTPEHLELLNQYYKPNHQAEKGVVTLCTHNRQADKINRDKLDALKGKSQYFEADVDRDFPEHLFPLGESLELKVGAQVMFIKNDTDEEKAYFNGKLAEVIELNEDGICVRMDGHDEYWLKKHEWENKRYLLNETSQDLEEEVIGTYSQYPLRLAWAITVHKSQGLTFDKAVIDVGRAFAPGQVYVALSRLRSLDGLVLRTPISGSVISSDSKVVSFSKVRKEDTELEKQLEQGRQVYLYNLLQSTFNFDGLVKQLNYVQQKHGGKMEFEDEEMQTALNRLRKSFEAEMETTSKFRNQLHRLLVNQEHEQLLERLEKGSAYYLKFLSVQLKNLLIHIEEVNQFAKTKTYVSGLEELDQMLMNQAVKVHKSRSFTQSVLADEKLDRVSNPLGQTRARIQEEVAKYIKAHPKTFRTKTGRKRKTKAEKAKKGATYDITYQMFNDGKTMEEIAKEREMAMSTIEGHISKGIGQGTIKADKVLADEDLKTITKAFEENPSKNLTEIYTLLKKEYSYGKLRMAQAAMRAIDAGN